MKDLLIILSFLFISLQGMTQTDSLLNTAVSADTLLKDTTKIKEAPESLQSLLGEIMEQQTKDSKSDVELELDGMLYDETKTKSGKDFYDFFYNMWEAPPGAKNYSIYITEMPYRLSTTQIEVKINDIIVFQSFLQPRADIVEELAQYAVGQTQLYLANYEELMQQMGGEDQAGSGIY